MVLRLLLVLVPALTLCGADLATIVNSGSTNQPGFRIQVERSGKATYTPAKAKSTGRKIDKKLAQRFYQDLDAAKPLSGLKGPRCMKSASFGSTLMVEVGADKTPDLSCGDGGEAKLKALVDDTNEIVKLFSNQPTGTVR
jgi:hypothetical protein